MTIFLFLSTVETIAVAIYLILIGSQTSHQAFFGLSVSRFFSVMALLVIVLLFVLLTIIELRQNAKRKNFISVLLVNPNMLLMLFSVSAMLMGSMFYLLTRSPYFGGDFKMIIHQSEPLFAWLLLIAAQTCFFIALWVSIYFILNKGEKSVSETKKELLYVICLFIVALVVKWFIVSAASFGPTGTGDEMTYYDMTDSLKRGFFSISQTYHYPPLYPLILVPALVFKQYTFTGIKLINAVVTTSILFPTYFISRSYLDSKKSLFLSLIACLLPYNLVFPRRIVSENLYFPIFLWSVFMILKKPTGRKTDLVWDFFTGICLGLLYLTRYISLAIIPMFLLAWWIKPFDNNDLLLHPTWKKIFRFLLLIIIICALFSPWVIGALLEKVPVKLILGFVITSTTNAKQLTILNLLIWILLYSAYMILMAAPVLPLMAKSLKHLNKNNWRDEYGRFIIQIFFLLVAFMAASVRHSWRAYYNGDYPAAIMGRYVLYPCMLFIILGFVTLEMHKKNNLSCTQKNFILMLVLSFILVTLAHFIIIEQKVINVGPFFLRLESSVDVYHEYLMGYFFFILIATLYTLYDLHFFNKQRKWVNNVIPLVMSIFFFTGCNDYYNLLIETQTYPWLSNEISHQARALLTDDQLSNGISLFVPPHLDNKHEAELYNGLRVRAIDNTRIFEFNMKNVSNMPTQGGFILHIYSPQDATQFPGKIYQFNNTLFTLEPVIK